MQELMDIRVNTADVVKKLLDPKKKCELENICTPEMCELIRNNGFNVEYDVIVDAIYELFSLYGTEINRESAGMTIEMFQWFVVDMYNKHYGNDDSIIEYLDKFRKHIRLELARCETYFTEFRKDIDESKDQTKLLKGESNRLHKQSEELKAETNNLKIQIISILGIFSAVILVFFGSSSIISNAATIFNGEKPIYTLMFTSMVGFITFNVVMGFLNFIGKFVYTHKLDKNKQRQKSPVQIDKWFTIGINIIFILAIVYSVFNLSK